MHCCNDMIYGLEEARSVVYIPQFREYGIVILDGGSSMKVINYCPWCGTQLPSPLRDEWFEEIRKLGLEPFDDPTPEHLQGETWWRQPDKSQTQSLSFVEEISPEKRNKSMDFQHLQLIIRKNDDAVPDQVFTDLISSGDIGVLPFLTDLLRTTSSDLLRNQVALALRDLGDPKAVPALVQCIAEGNTKNIDTLLYALIPFDPREHLLILVDAVYKTDHAGDYEAIVKLFMIIDEFKGPIRQDQREQALSQLDSYMQNATLPIWKQELLNSLHHTIASYDIE